MTTQIDTFSFETIEELTQQYFEENECAGNAIITYDNGFLTLVVVEYKTCDIQVFHVKEDETLYAKMDKTYVNIVENMSTGSDFWDKWDAMLEIFEPFKIVDNTFNP